MLTTFVLAIANLDYFVGEFGTVRQYPLLTLGMFAVSIFASFIMVKGAADGYDSMRGRLRAMPSSLVVVLVSFYLLDLLSFGFFLQRIPLDSPYILFIAGVQGVLAIIWRKKAFPPDSDTGSN